MTPRVHCLGKARAKKKMNRGLIEIELVSLRIKINETTSRVVALVHCIPAVLLRHTKNNIQNATMPSQANSLCECTNEYMSVGCSSLSSPLCNSSPSGARAVQALPLHSMMKIGPIVNVHLSKGGMHDIKTGQSLEETFGSRNSIKAHCSYLPSEDFRLLSSDRHQLKLFSSQFPSCNTSFILTTICQATTASRREDVLQPTSSTNPTRSCQKMKGA